MNFGMYLSVQYIRISSYPKLKKSPIFLGGEGKLAVAGLARTNYVVALKLLHERYGNKQEKVDLHYKELMITYHLQIRFLR